MVKPQRGMICGAKPRISSPNIRDQLPQMAHLFLFLEEEDINFQLVGYFLCEYESIEQYIIPVRFFFRLCKKNCPFLHREPSASGTVEYSVELRGYSRDRRWERLPSFINPANR
jgi:hypothetical protein